jgi:hypothetical protein
MQIDGVTFSPYLFFRLSSSRISHVTSETGTSTLWANLGFRSPGVGAGADDPRFDLQGGLQGDVVGGGGDTWKHAANDDGESVCDDDSDDEDSDEEVDDSEDDSTAPHGESSTNSSSSSRSSVRSQRVAMYGTEPESWREVEAWRRRVQTDYEEGTIDRRQRGASDECGSSSSSTNSSNSSNIGTSNSSNDGSNSGSNNGSNDGGNNGSNYGGSNGSNYGGSNGGAVSEVISSSPPRVCLTGRLASSPAVEWLLGFKATTFMADLRWARALQTQNPSVKFVVSLRKPSAWLRSFVRSGGGGAQRRRRRA